VLKQLHMLLFMMAVVHIVLSVLVLLLSHTQTQGISSSQLCVMSNDSVLTPCASNVLYIMAWHVA